MKRAYKLYLLAGVLALACLATWAVMRYEEKREQIKNSGEVILEIPTDSVQSLSWEYEEESLAFHRDETWLYDGDEEFPVDQEKINGLLEQFREFTAAFIIEEVEDYSQYGLEEPECTIQLSTEEQTYEIQLGSFSTMDAQRYVSIGDGNVYLVEHDPLEDFDAVLSDLIDHDETPSFDQVTELSFTGAEAYSILYEEESADTYCADDVYFAQLDGERLPLDTARVSSYLKDITRLGLTDYVTYNATGEELESYGLNDPELIITINYTGENEDGEETENTFVLSVSRDPEQRQAAQEESEEETEEESEEEEILAYARVGESRIVYQISETDYEKLMAAAYDDLRHREVVTAAFEDITQIDITLEDQSYTITMEETDDGNLYDYLEEEVDISDLQSALEKLRSSRFTDEEPADKEEVSLTLHLDNENHPTIQVALYRYSGDECLAVLDGAPLSLVDRSKTMDLVEAIYAIVLN